VRHLKKTAPLPSPFFLLAAILFTHILRLIIGLLAAAIYHAVFRRNRKVIARSPA
jgi:hypothetical protein